VVGVGRHRPRTTDKLICAVKRGERGAEKGRIGQCSQLRLISLCAMCREGMQRASRIDSRLPQCALLWL
jgi:hypothetical protein